MRNNSYSCQKTYSETWLKAEVVKLQTLTTYLINVDTTEF